MLSPVQSDLGVALQLMCYGFDGEIVDAECPPHAARSPWLQDAGSSTGFSLSSGGSTQVNLCLFSPTGSSAAADLCDGGCSSSWRALPQPHRDMCALLWPQSSSEGPLCSMARGVGQPANWEPIQPGRSWVSAVGRDAGSSWWW